MKNCKKGDIYYVDFDPVLGSEQGGTRPALIIQNDKGNEHSPCTIVAIITSRSNKTRIPTHIDLLATALNGLSKDSMIELEQIRTIDKKRLKWRCGRIGKATQMQVDKALKISLQLEDE